MHMPSLPGFLFYVMIELITWNYISVVYAWSWGLNWQPGLHSETLVSPNERTLRLFSQGCHNNSMIQRSDLNAFPVFAFLFVYIHKNGKAWVCMSSVNVPRGL